MRSKEDAHDYRYFPDPDLLPLEIDDAFIEGIRVNLPELPDQKRTRFETDYGLSRYDAGVLTADAESADFYETVAKGRDPKLAANWVTQELFGYLNKAELELSESPVSAEQLGGLIDLISGDVISGKIAKDVFQRMLELQARVRTQTRRKRFVDILRRRVDRGLELSVIDHLTGLYNRRYMLERLQLWMQRSAVNEKPVSIVAFDIDHFKKVNDRYGHEEAAPYR